MNFLKHSLLAGFIMTFMNLSVDAQSADYQALKTVKPEMQRKMLANELMLSSDGKYLIVNYGSRPTYIIAYRTEDWGQEAFFRLPDWVDFASAYVDTTNSQIYIKTSRTSSEYYRLDIAEKTQDIVPCEITPRRCPVIELKKDVKALYTDDKRFYIAINKQNKREVRVYEKRMK